MAANSPLYPPLYKVGDRVYCALSPGEVLIVVRAFPLNKLRSHLPEGVDMKLATEFIKKWIKSTKKRDREFRQYFLYVVQGEKRQFVVAESELIDECVMPENCSL